MNTPTRKLDIIVYGATGFTGGLVAEYLSEASESTPLRWALAGRSLEKLNAVRARLPEVAGREKPELIVADATDASSLARMAEQTRVVITTVGPYILYGEPLVRACAEAGTDYVDLTGEPEFAEAMAERYHERAASTGARIVHACGFDSIPHDLGAYYTLQQLHARMTPEERAQAPVTIEGFVRTKGTFSGGTLHSALEIMSRMGEHAREHKRRMRNRPHSERKAVVLRKAPSFRKEIGMWAVPLPTIDPMVVVRSAELLPQYGPDFRYGHYLGVKNLAQVAGVIVGAGTIFTLAQLPPTKALLKKLKDPGEGPDEETRKKSFFRVLFQARGAGQEVSCEVRGGDPGYGETSKMLAESALCLALDRNRLPPYLGNVTTAAGMGNALIDRLQNAGIAFRTLS